jgi:IrrE N-terminal-like domain
MSGPSRRRLRKRCEERLRDLPIPVPFDARAFTDELAAGRRPIRLVPMSGLTGVCGMWVATDTTDLIFYEQDTTPPHQEHIILHELSHLICDHYPPAAVEAQHLLPNLDAEMVRRVLGRAGYSTEEEREAELLATLIRQRARSNASTTLTARLHAALDDDRG